ncbi:MAG: hypothetical protein ABI323_11775 [Solirubrobacteraceae bacterium]
MRRSLFAVVLVTSVLGLALALEPAGAAHSQARSSSVSSSLLRIPNALRRGLQRYLDLAAHPRHLAPRALLVPNLRIVPQGCEVGLPRCSLTPCVEFATTSSAVLLSTATFVGPGLPPPSAPRCRAQAPSRGLLVAAGLPVAVARP